MTDRVITWAGLLAKWTEFAQSAAALPKTEAGERLRACVPSIIGLQAITHALAELDALPEDEYALGQDRAEVVIKRHAGEIHGAWGAEPLPEALGELIGDARLALRATREAGVEFRVGDEPLIAEHPGELGAGLVAQGFAGDVYLPAPGVPLFEGCPAGFVRSRTGAKPGKDVLGVVREFLEQTGARVGKGVRVAGMRQAYRQFDFGTGRVRRDLVVSMRSELPGGQPLLVPVVVGGELQPVPLAPPPGFDPGEVKVVFEEGWE
ncbi:MAG: hypothetical protein GC200_06875 [Tepidisphaera sp.]|nr:hypothetical protein [Tepidisphaera sp.]